MKKKHIITFFFSLFSVCAFAQEKPAKEKFWNFSSYEPNVMVGVDVLNAGFAFFSDRKLYQGFVSTEIKKGLHAVADVGFDNNVYQKNGYDAEVKGPFIKLGSYYMMVEDPEDRFNGFYLGGKLAGAFYRQEYRAVPIRGYQGGDYYAAFPSSSQSSYWIEGAAGGRVRLFSSNFYIDVNMQPKYLLFTTKQDDIKPMIVSGFGKSSTHFNVGFAWNIAYRF